MARYTNGESLKIEYFKSKIKETRYLKYELSNSESKIEEINYKLTQIRNTNNLNNCIIKNHQNYKIEEKWNKLIQEKEELINKINTIKKELQYVDVILQTLSPNIREMAIDLLVRKFSLGKIRDKYYVSNPYQCINDELKYLEIDEF